MNMFLTIVSLLFSTAALAAPSESFLCAEDSTNRWVVRVISEDSLTLSRYDGHKKTYFDVDFNLDNVAATESGQYLFESDVQTPDGDDVWVKLTVDPSTIGQQVSARWLGIEFFPNNTQDHFRGVIEVNGIENLATCIAI